MKDHSPSIDVQAMLLTFRHGIAGCFGAAAIAFFVLATFALLRSAGDLEQALGDADLVLLGTLFAGLSTCIALTWAAWSVRRTLSGLSAQVTSARHSPARANIGGDHLTAGQIEQLGSLYGEFTALCNSYRQALADRIKQREALDTLRARLAEAEGEGDGGERGHRQPSRRPAGASRNMIARLTPNFRWMNATPALLKFLGRPLVDLNSRSFFDVVEQKSFEVASTRLAEILQSGEGHNVELRILVRRRRTAEGAPQRQIVERRYVRMDALTRYGDDGKPMHLRCYFEDITERVRAERQLHRRTAELALTNENLLRMNEDLQRLKESYRDLYHNAPIMFFSLDAAGKFVACNDTMLQSLGYQRDELFQKPFTRMLTEEGAQAWENARTQAGQGDPPHLLMVDGEAEMQWVKRDGTIIDVWIRSILLTETDGQFVRSRSAAHDVSQRNRLANELRRRGDELELANSELRTINKELDEFTFAVSHGLKEPLRTLQACSNVLADDFSTQLGADGFEWVNHILTASRRLTKMIDDFLSMARAGNIATTPRVFHLNEAIAVVRRDLGDMISRKNATLIVEGSLPDIVGDLERVTQLFGNLVANGLKYNKSAQPQVLIGESDKVVQPGFTTLFVRDNGIGIDPKFHQEIFRVFRRLHLKEEYEGTGAGLAICHKIVQAHAGRIWVESALGQGSTFFFTLPRTPQESGLLPVAAAPALVARAGNGVALSADLLLVEDMAEMALIVQRFARKAGHDFHWVPTAEAAWDFLQNHRPDLVLLDIHLPGMDGIELCQKLRAQPNHAGLPIALFSQDVTPEDIRTGLAAGANFVLSKRLLCEPDAWRQQLHQILHSCKQTARGA
jgi:PAS domain S-box-containing protein